jgi:ABC-type glycerol-3-phosphate transport system substrate-binding protein
MSLTRLIDPKNVRKADIVYFGLGICVLFAAALSVFLFKEGKILPLKRVTVVFTQWWDSGMDTGTLERVLADFERENPLIRARTHNAGWEDIRDGLFQTEADAPDLVAVDPVRLDEVIASGLLEALPAIDSDNAETTALAAEDLRRYYLPVVSFLHPLFYNIDILTAAGLSRPPKTREEFLTYAQKTTSVENGVYGTALSRNVWTDIFPWIWTSGVGDLTEKLNWTGRAVTDTLYFFSALNKTGLYPLPLSKREDELLEAFTAGKIAMFVSSQASIAEIRAKKPALNFDVTTIPPAAQMRGRNIFPVTEWALAIPVKSTHKEEALILLRYLSKRKNDLAVAAHGITGRPSTGSGEDPATKKLRALYEASGAAAVSVIGARTETKLNEVREAILTMFQSEKNEAETAAAIQAAFIQADLPETARTGAPPKQ